MKRCAVCGKEVGFFSDEVVKGASGEYVCRKCLFKAKTSDKKFQWYRIYASQIRDNIEKGTPIQAKIGQPFFALIVLGVVLIFFFVFISSIVNTPSTSTDDSTVADSSTTEEYVPTQIPLEIKRAVVAENTIGQTVMTLIVTNNTEYTIDAFDYKIEAYNAYGEKVKGLFSGMNYTSQNIQIKPGFDSTAETAVDIIYEATSFKVAIERYHIAETDETVSISSKDRVWYNCD